MKFPANFWVRERFVVQKRNEKKRAQICNLYRSSARLHLCDCAFTYVSVLSAFSGLGYRSGDTCFGTCANTILKCLAWLANPAQMPGFGWAIQDLPHVCQRYQQEAQLAYGRRALAIACTRRAAPRDWSWRARFPFSTIPCHPDSRRRHASFSLSNTAKHRFVCCFVFLRFADKARPPVSEWSLLEELYSPCTPYTLRPTPYALKPDFDPTKNDV